MYPFRRFHSVKCKQDNTGSGYNDSFGYESINSLKRIQLILDLEICKDSL